MQEVKEKRNGDFNVNAKDYEGKTNIRMLPPDQDAEFDKRISEKVGGVKNAVGEDAWNELTDGQKTAVTDIAYANGSLDEFKNLRDAIKAGDARKMADESTFYTDSKTGKRDEGRLLRNYEAL